MQLTKNVLLGIRSRNADVHTTEYQSSELGLADMKPVQRAHVGLMVKGLLHTLRINRSYSHFICLIHINKFCKEKLHNSEFMLQEG